MAWEKTDDEIIAYLSGEFTPEEEKAFEKRLQEEPSLAGALERHRAFEEKLRNYGAYKQKIEEIEQLNQQFSQTQSTSRRYTYVYLAAAVLAILIAVIWFLQPDQKYTPEELVAEFFVPRFAPDIAGQGEDAEQILRMAHSRFNQRSFDEAINLYKEVLSSDSLNATLRVEAQFYLGQSLMKQDDFDEALHYLNRITDGPYSQLGQWYTALSYLALNRTEEARVILEKIAQNPTHDQYKDAGSL
ncbi:MAG: tetratricopeptide repeat protein, partial [Bacteroidetes bacterium]|nr:tetratricopeptide repeat protein [Bacteroidota bacterium]